MAQHGSDAWWRLPLDQLLPPALSHLAPTLRRGEDTMDVWFDSGSSWAGVVQAGEKNGLRFPADLYLEGSDQHRGWFQSSLLTAVAATGSAPYKQVLTHGFVLDERGAKMSKSVVSRGRLAGLLCGPRLLINCKAGFVPAAHACIASTPYLCQTRLTPCPPYPSNPPTPQGNVVDPRAVIEGGKDQKKDPPYGADVLRLWVASVDYSNDVMVRDSRLCWGGWMRSWFGTVGSGVVWASTRKSFPLPRPTHPTSTPPHPQIGPGILKQVSESYRKLRGTLRFLLGSLADFDPAVHAVPYDELPSVDRFVLGRHAEVMEDVRDAYETYQVGLMGGWVGWLVGLGFWV